ncbi:MAG TPA: single-stranded DNA-binding protein [Bacteroidales bacterium]|jgi:single-strand DNA-binding protein|nr:single-stranded DNA-binding protein [Bacteroidales bacterium]
MKDLKNKVQLIGNLGNDPEIKNLENGRKLAKFSLATNQVYTDQKGEKVEDTQWHNIVAWGKDADRVEKFLAKGSYITLEGRIVYRNYEDNTGQKKYFTEIVMSDMVLPPKN